LAKSYENGGIAKGPGRIFEPLVVYIRDVLFLILERKLQKYMSYLLTIFSVFLNIFGLTPLGINATGNHYFLALITFLIQTLRQTNIIRHIFWMPGVPKPMRIY
jgi:F-type H+-transporting ATPase subunit a